MKITTQTQKKLKQKVSQRFSILLDIMNDQKKVDQNLTHKRSENPRWPPLDRENR